MPPSIKDIARRAGVSTATISRVINDSPKVRPETKGRVHAIIKKYDYRPNLMARGLVRGKSQLLTLIVPPQSNFFSAYYFRQVFCGLSDALAAHQYRLMIYQPAGYDPDLGYPPRLDGLQMDGLFIVAPLLQDRLVKYLEETRRPAVLINARSGSLDWVDVDNVRASVQVVQCLAGMGHRRIGYIGGGAGGHNAAARLEGYRRGLEKTGLAADAGLVAGGDYTPESGYENAKKLLSLAHPPTAVYAANDMMALGVLRAAVEMGRAVPRDLSLVGFDDADVAALSHPPLSTVRQPFYEMGKSAGLALIARVQGPETPQRAVEFTGDIIWRDSCASPKNP